MLGQHPWKVTAAIGRCHTTPAFIAAFAQVVTGTLDAAPALGSLQHPDVTTGTDPRNGSCHKCSLEIPDAGSLQPQTSLLHQAAEEEAEQP